MFRFWLCLWQKTALLALLLAAIGLHGKDFSYPEWVRVMSDRGDETSRWFMVSSPSRAAVKKLTLDFPVSEVAEAVLEYQIQVAPYDPILKQHIRTANYPWANFVAHVNGQLILDEPAASYISMGVHHLRFPVKCLQEGENTITMTWKKLPADNPEKRQYGYVYFTQDLPKASVQGKSDEPNLRIRLLLRFRDGAE